MTYKFITSLVMSILLVGCKAVQLAPHPIPVVLPTDTTITNHTPTTRAIPSAPTLLMPNKNKPTKAKVGEPFFILEDWF